MYIMYKLKVFSHFTCYGLCYPLSAKARGFTPQTKVAVISPSEESGGCLPWGQWGGNWIFRVSVTFFWICLPLTQHEHGSYWHQVKHHKFTVSFKAFSGHLPSCPQSHRDAHDVLSLSTQAGSRRKSQGLDTPPDLRFHLWIKWWEVIVQQWDSAFIFFNKIEQNRLCWETSSINALQRFWAFAWLHTCPQWEFCQSSSFCINWHLSLSGKRGGPQEEATRSFKR